MSDRVQQARERAERLRSSDDGYYRIEDRRRATEDVYACAADALFLADRVATLETALRVAQATVGTCEYALLTGNDNDRIDATLAIEEFRAALAGFGGDSA